MHLCRNSILVFVNAKIRVLGLVSGVLALVLVEKLRFWILVSGSSAIAPGTGTFAL